MRDSLYALIHEQIDTMPTNTRFVFIQPSYLPQHTVLEMMLHEPQCVYIRVDQDLPLHEILQRALTEQFDSSGLSGVRKLIIDECDRSPDNDIEALLVELLQFPELRVLILSRSIPAFVRTNELIRAATRIVPYDPALMFPDYLSTTQTMLLEVRALGVGHVLLNGIPVMDWDGDLPRNLFFFLIDRGMATRAQIFEAFWPELSIHEATNVFHVTKRKINEILGIDITYYSGGFYRIASGIELVYDVSMFKEFIQSSAVESGAVAHTLLSRAIRLYRADFLNGLDVQFHPWVHSRREEMRQSYGEALLALGKSTEQSGDRETALGLFIRSSAINRQREDLAGLIMGLYRDLGMYADALKTYDQIELEIATALGISPAQWLQDLAANIRDRAKTAAKISEHR